MILEVIGRVSLDAALLRSQLPDLVLRPGMTLPARVHAREGAHGVLVLRGAPLVAALPEGIEAGERLRLTVAEVGPDRVVLRVADTPPAPPAAPAGALLPMPDGRPARVTVEERAAGGRGRGEPAAVALTYASPALGDLDLRVEVGAAGVVVTVRARAGESHERAHERADVLRAALADRFGRPAVVHVVARRDPLDLYA